MNCNPVHNMCVNVKDLDRIITSLLFIIYKIYISLIEKYSSFFIVPGLIL